MPAPDLPAALPRVPLDVIQGKAQVRDGIAVCRVYLGRLELPITWRHKVAARHDYEFRGYSLDGEDAIFRTWGELAQAWPDYYERRIAGAKERRSA